MNVLLDSSALIYAASNPLRLTPAARHAIESGDNALFVCAISGFEIGVAIAKGRLQISDSPAHWLGRAQARLGYAVLDVDLPTAVEAALLPRHHLDGFDRLIISTARRHHMPIVTDDRQIPHYDVTVIW